MNSNLPELKISPPEKTTFWYDSKTGYSSELKCLRQFKSLCGRVPVEVFGVSESSTGKIFYFYPIDKPTIQRMAPMCNFEITPVLQKLLSL